MKEGGRLCTSHPGASGPVGDILQSPNAASGAKSPDGEGRRPVLDQPTTASGRLVLTGALTQARRVAAVAHCTAGRRAGGQSAQLSALSSQLRDERFQALRPSAPHAAHTQNSGV